MTSTWCYSIAAANTSLNWNLAINLYFYFFSFDKHNNFFSQDFMGDHDTNWSFFLQRVCVVIATTDSLGTLSIILFFSNPTHASSLINNKLPTIANRNLFPRDHYNGVCTFKVSKLSQYEELSCLLLDELNFLNF